MTVLVFFMWLFGFFMAGVGSYNLYLGVNLLRNFYHLAGYGRDEWDKSSSFEHTIGGILCWAIGLGLMAAAIAVSGEYL